MTKLDFYNAIMKPPTRLGDSAIDALMELFSRIEELEYNSTEPAILHDLDPKIADCVTKQLESFDLEAENIDNQINLRFKAEKELREVRERAGLFA